MVGFYPYNSSLRSILSAFIFITVFYIPATKAAPSFQLFPNKPLLDGATLVSSGGIFELGFFYPGSSANRYVGIWYHNFSTSTVLWVANREFPVLDKSGSLAIAEDGNLVVLDGHKSVLWSSKVTSLHSNQSSAELLDSGNLVLKNSGAMVWQSFDQPGDTYLPGMIVGLDLVTKVNQVFTSWRSDDDPAPGNFSLGIAPDQSTQLFLWEGSKPRWRSGRWNGQVFIGIQNMVPNYTYGLKFGNFQLRGNKMYFYYSQFNSSHRYVLRPDGVVRHLVWANDTKSWYEYWAQPISQCEIYNRCGNYATCSDSPDGNSPNCTCLKGFERGSGDLSGECVRKTPLQCKRNVNGSAAGGGSALDGFYLMQGVKLPDLSDWDSSGPSNDSACEEACSTNCSCKAYSYVTGIGCLTWGRDLVDIHLFSGGGNDFYLRLAGSEFGSQNGLFGNDG